MAFSRNKKNIGGWKADIYPEVPLKVFLGETERGTKAIAIHGGHQKVSAGVSFTSKTALKALIDDLIEAGNELPDD